MAVTKHTTPVSPETTRPVEHRADFWTRYSKPLMIAFAAIVLIVGGYLAYKSFILEPKQEKAEEALFKAEEYFRTDSLDRALNGQGPELGLLKVISRYDGTAAANRAHFMAGNIYLRKGDFKNAIKHLEEFDTDAPQIKARAISLIADAYSEMGHASNNNGNKEKAAELYEKAAGVFEKDHINSPEYLFRAGALYQVLGKNKDAIEAYKTIKKKYPTSPRGLEIDKYLARLGELE